MSHTEKHSLERPPGISDAEWAKVLVRWEHAERWVAWRRTRGTEQFVAAADTPEEIHKIGEDAGIKGVSYEWVPPAFRLSVSTMRHEDRLAVEPVGPGQCLGS